jgi:hypothetical protein
LRRAPTAYSTETFDELQPGQPGHLDIGNYNVRSKLIYRGTGEHRVGDGPDIAAATALEHGAGVHRNIGVVIDDEDPICVFPHVAASQPLDQELTWR